jgi:hypothetical protein
MPGPKDTAALRDMAKLQKKRAAAKTERKACHDGYVTALNLQKALNGNHTRGSRPTAGSMKDRENSDPSDGEEEAQFIVKKMKPTSEKKKEISILPNVEQEAVDLLLHFAGF